MLPCPPRSTPTHTLYPCTTLYLSPSTPSAPPMSPSRRWSPPGLPRRATWWNYTAHSAADWRTSLCMGRKGTERSTRAVRLDAQLTNWECSQVTEQQVSTREIHTSHNRRDLTNPTHSTKTRTFTRTPVTHHHRDLHTQQDHY